MSRATQGKGCNPARMAWAENLFQKLEALCSEVEDVKWTMVLLQSIAGHMFVNACMLILAVVALLGELL
ncbi:hypothetical protein Tsubulata_032088 [Turnera subulata]|uniref:Uncharacterized protein n=1 Tax=Turnera subulata TaxID=218843 RepID=A0A9Q0FAH8_9ROSI|nr:hypothetical protein Tsubulata_032088 [Turnera subulata]